MQHLEDKRVWMAGGALAAVLIVAVGWFMFIGPELSSTNDLHSQAAATRQQNTMLQLKVKSLQLKSTQLRRYTRSLKASLLALPVDSGLPAFTRQLTAQGADNKVAVTSVAIGGVSAVAPAAAPAPATTDGSVPTDTTTPTTPATTVPAGTTAAPAGLVSVQVTVQSNGTLTHQLAFLNAIRTVGPRRALLTASQVSPGTGATAGTIDGAASFTTSLTIFSAPETPQQITQLKKLLSGNLGN